jgi:hypothetical protein
MTQSITPQQLITQSNYAAGAAREALATAQGHSKALDAVNNQLNALTKLIQMSRTGANTPPNLQYVENIPGRRIPFDLLTMIPIGNNLSSVQQGTITVSQEGPFVAVSRFATFLSQFQLQRIDPVTGAKAQFFGRSFGRYRPIHSAWDIMDGMPRQEVTQSVAFPGTGAPHTLSPSNGSPFRTMEADYSIEFLNAGSSFPRSNMPVPSSFWTSQINSAFDLGALDVFERGEQLTFNVLPQHVNNPSFGNIQSFSAGDAGNYPFLASGWDYIEGINDQVNDAAGSTDPITRLANGILIIGFHGYRIVQPPGSGPY